MAPIFSCNPHSVLLSQVAYDVCINHGPLEPHILFSASCQWYTSTSGHLCFKGNQIVKRQYSMIKVSSSLPFFKQQPLFQTSLIPSPLIVPDLPASLALQSLNYLQFTLPSIHFGFTQSMLALLSLWATFFRDPLFHLKYPAICWDLWGTKEK